jgi:hypothetical protein
VKGTKTQDKQERRERIKESRRKYERQRKFRSIWGRESARHRCWNEERENMYWVGGEEGKGKKGRERNGGEILNEEEGKNRKRKGVEGINKKSQRSSMEYNKERF